MRIMGNRNARRLAEFRALRTEPGFAMPLASASGMVVVSNKETEGK
jgi:hypothetical protein